jgi:hypothetical protein
VCVCGIAEATTGIRKLLGRFTNGCAGLNLLLTFLTRTLSELAQQ